MYEQLIEIVKQAGAMIREAHEAEIPVYDKEGIANFVTKYDKDVQSFLIRNFRQLLPEANFLAEEDGIRQEPVSYTHLDVYKRQSRRKRYGFFWNIVPLDLKLRD